MGKISATNYKKLCSYISDHYFAEKHILEDYFSIFSEEIISNSGVSVTLDEFIEILCDGSSKEFIKLVENLKIHIEEQGESSKIGIDYSPPYHYIYNTEFGKNAHNGKYREILTKLDTIFNLDVNNGKFYQTFCTLFLKDLGIHAYETSHSGDDGLDIIAEINIKLENDVLRHLIQKTMILLVQVKFHKTEIDTSVIRHIIGDSLLFKFNKSDIMSKPIQLAVISHKGFTIKAQQFASKHGVIIIDSKKMIDLLLNHNNPRQLSSLNYLNLYYNQLIE
jgi:HJR/Mrr/RecB family endonuclease